MAWKKLLTTASGLPLTGGELTGNLTIPVDAYFYFGPNARFGGGASSGDWRVNQNDGSSWSDNLYIKKSDGKVGLGLGTGNLPTEALHVGGNGLFTGNELGHDGSQTGNFQVAGNQDMMFRIKDSSGNWENRMLFRNDSAATSIYGNVQSIGQMSLTNAIIGGTNYAGNLIYTADLMLRGDETGAVFDFTSYQGHLGLRANHTGGTGGNVAGNANIYMYTTGTGTIIANSGATFAGKVQATQIGAGAAPAGGYTCDITQNSNTFALYVHGTGSTTEEFVYFNAPTTTSDAFKVNAASLTGTGAIARFIGPGSIQALGLDASNNALFGGRAIINGGGAGTYNNSLEINNASSVPSRIFINNTGSTGYTGADIVLQTHHGSRGAGLYTYNTAEDREWYMGTAYGQPNEWHLCTESASAFQVASAETAHSVFYINTSGSVFADGHITAGLNLTAVDGTFTGDVHIDNGSTHAYCKIDSGSTSHASWVNHKLGGSERWLAGVEGSQTDYQLYSTLANNTGVRFRISATTGNVTIGGNVSAGTIGSGTITSTGNIVGVAGTFSGAVSGTTGTFTNHVVTSGTYAYRAYGVGVDGGTNTEHIEMLHTGNAGRIDVKQTGTGAYEPFQVFTGGSQSFEVDENKNATFGGEIAGNGTTLYGWQSQYKVLQIADGMSIASDTGVKGIWWNTYDTGTKKYAEGTGKYGANTYFSPADGSLYHRATTATGNADSTATFATVFTLTKDGDATFAGDATVTGNLFVKSTGTVSSAPPTNTGKIEYASNRFYFHADAGSEDLAVFRRGDSDVIELHNSGGATFTGDITVTGQNYLRVLDSGGGNYIELVREASFGRVKTNGNPLLLDANGAVIRVDGGDFHVDDGDATFDQDVSVGGDVAITGGVQVLDTDGIVFAPSSGSNSHVKVASTGDLEIYSAGGDLDIPVWLRMRASAGGGGVTGAWKNDATSKLHLGGDCTQTDYTLKIDATPLTSGSLYTVGNAKFSGEVYAGGASGLGTSKLQVLGTTTTSLGDPQMVVYGGVAVGSISTIGFGHIEALYPESPIEIGYKSVNAGAGSYGDLIFATRSTGTGAPTIRLTVGADGNSTFAGDVRVAADKTIILDPNSGNIEWLSEGGTRRGEIVADGNGIHYQTGQSSTRVFSLPIAGTSLRMSGSADIIWETDNVGDIGASGATRPRDLHLGRNATVGNSLTVGGETEFGDDIFTGVNNDLYIGGEQGGNIINDGSGQDIVFKTADELVLTLDSDQDATFVGNVGAAVITGTNIIGHKTFLSHGTDFKGGSGNKYVPLYGNSNTASTSAPAVSSRYLKGYYWIVPFNCYLKEVGLVSEVASLGNTTITVDCAGIFTHEDETMNVALAETAYAFSFNLSLTKGALMFMQIDTTNAAQALVYNLVFKSR